jgi:cell division protein FtsZ
MVFDPESIMPPGAKIKVLGVGGGGGNAVNTMIKSGLEGVEFITANTDVQSLRFSLAATKLQLGRELTKGLGAGADPDIGRDAALEDRHAIQEVLADADMVFITAGMGGGTGTGGASVVAQIARELGALTVAVVTKPFNFEGKRRRKHADLGIARLRESVDTLITIPNQRLLQIATPDLSMVDAFKMADNVLVNAVRGISDIINIPGTVNVDFADVKTVMSSMGHALMGIGVANGPSRAVEAARQAISSPLLEDVDIEGATGILINITAGSSVTLMEVNEACSIIQEAAHEDANIIFGAVIDDSMGENIRVTVIATGFPVEGDEADVIGSGLVRPQSSSIIQPFGTSRLTTPVQRPTPSYAHRSQSSRMAVQQSAAAQPRVAPQAPAPEVTRAPIVEDLTRSEPVHAPSPAMAVVSEAQELARWTLGESPHFESNQVSSEKIEETLSFTMDENREPAVEFHQEIRQEVRSEIKIEGAVGQPLRQRTVSEALFEELDDNSLNLGVSERSRPVGATSSESGAPLENFFESDMKLVSDIDRKIDEALALADRLREKPEAHGDDDLDVPAFLRSGMKDLPLG